MDVHLFRNPAPAPKPEAIMSSKLCGACRAAGYPGDIYCPRCGTPFDHVCRRCGTPVAHPVAMYCVRCGSELT